MKRSTMFLLCSLLATPAIAQQPIPPSPPQPSQYGQPIAPPQYAPPQNPQSPPPQYADPNLQQPYATDGDADDEEEDGYDVTYDVSTDPNAQDQYDDGYDPNAYQQFQSQLSPYGEWQDDPNYGQVWTPSQAVVGSDFSPYATGGNWINSDYGWTWNSDYDWGWAPFHYGRWMVIGGRGWSWIPGTVWGPAWVNWRWGGGYAGWAPMAPHGVVIGPPRGVRGPWRFTVAAQLGTRNASYLPARVVPSVWSHTQTISNARNVSLGGATVRISSGPPAHLVAAAVGHPIATASLQSVAPRSLPRASITPRVGTPMQSRPWMQRAQPGARPTVGRTISAGSPMTSRPLQSQRAVYSQPYRAPVYNNSSLNRYRAPASNVYRSTYAQPVSHAPVYNNSSLNRYGGAAPVYSGYHATYSAPSYSQPAYHAPVYSAPAYSAPAFHSAPTYSAPAASAPSTSFHSSGGFGGGGFHSSGGGGGHHR